MVRCFTVNGTRVALDTESGSIHAPDEISFKMLSEISEAARGANEAAEAISRLKSKCVPGLEECEALREIESLIEAGLLFSPPPVKPAAEKSNERVVKALCLHVAHVCNLRCAYCFAGQGAYGGGQMLMPAETAKRAVDFLIERSGSRRNLEIDFFGGEPLMNFETVKAAVLHAREREREAEKNFRFTLTTNATLLDGENGAFLNEQMDNVVLSADGRKSVHDRMRMNGDGAGGYEEVIPKIKRFVESRKEKNYYVRGTYTRRNLDFSNDALHLAGLGFKNISVEPVVCAANEPHSIRQSDLPVLFGEYERLAAEVFEKKFNFFHFNIDPEGGPCAKKRVTGCGAGSEYLAVAPDGSLYPCHQFAGEKKFRVGDLESGITNGELCDRFTKCSVHSKPECESCWAKYHCGGGCAAHAYFSNGDILSPDVVACGLQRKRVECALYLYVKENLA